MVVEGDVLVAPVRPVPAGVPQDGSSAVFAGIPGETFVIGSETPPEDASVASGIACSPPSMPAHCTVLFSASGAEKEISRTDSVQELICLGMLTVATSQVPSDRNCELAPVPFHVGAVSLRPQRQLLALVCSLRVVVQRGFLESSGTSRNGTSRNAPLAAWQGVAFVPGK